MLQCKGKEKLKNNNYSDYDQVYKDAEKYIFENMHIFNTNLDMEIVFTDKDFKPTGLMDFLFKFFGM